MLDGAGGGGEITSIRGEWAETGNALMDALGQSLRLYVSRVGGGDVQVTFGSRA